jgi:predicted double-glycine peptidase
MSTPERRKIRITTENVLHEEENMITIKKKWLGLFGAVLFVMAVIVGSIPEHFDYPPAHAIPNFPTAQQPDSITCGPTSTAMVLRHYGQDVTIEQVKQMTKTHWFGTGGDEVGMTAPDYIVRVLKQHGIRATLKNDNFDELKYEVSQDRPVIVLVRSGKKTWHYMVAIGYTEKQMIFSDPADGQYYNVDNEHFLLAWGHDGNCSGEDYRVDSMFGKSSDYMKVLLRATEILPKTYITVAP